MSTPEPSRPPVIAGQSLAPSRSGFRFHWAWLSLILFPVLVCVVGCAGGFVWLLYETGSYRSSNKIRITNSARSAFLEASQNKPGAFLYVEEYDHFTFRVLLQSEPPTGETVVNVRERGVPLTIDAQPFHNYFVLMKPTIVHDGRADKTQGYDLILKGLRGPKGDFPGPGRP